MSSFTKRLTRVIEDFSIGLLLKTLFSPWKRIITNPGRSIEDRFRAAGDNAFSRVVGFFVRLLVIITGLGAMLIVALLTLVEIILWPLVPLMVPGFIVIGLIK